MDLLFIALYGVYLLLNVMDGISTWLALRPDQLQREANPVARWIFARLGLPRGIIVAETLTLAILTPLIFLLAGASLILAKIALALTVMVFIWVVWDNLRVWRKVKKPKP